MMMKKTRLHATSFIFIEKNSIFLIQEDQVSFLLFCLSAHLQAIEFIGNG